MPQHFQVLQIRRYTVYGTVQNNPLYESYNHYIK